MINWCIFLESHVLFHVNRLSKRLFFIKQSLLRLPMYHLKSVYQFKNWLCNPRQYPWLHMVKHGITNKFHFYWTSIQCNLSCNASKSIGAKVENQTKLDNSRKLWYLFFTIFYHYCKKNWNWIIWMFAVSIWFWDSKILTLKSYGSSWVNSYTKFY